MGEQFGTLRLEHSSTVDRIAQELRRAMFEGELESGTPLREVALADSLGVSRPTVREALSVLVADGLAVREPNRGVAVASPDPDSIRDVCRARAHPGGVGVQAGPDVVPELLGGDGPTAHACPFQHRAGGSYQELNERHLDFHVSLVGLTGSERLVHMAEALVVELKLALAQVDRIRRNAHDQADSHTHLVQLLERGDVDAASAYLGQHLADAEKSLLDALDLR